MAQINKPTDYFNTVLYTGDGASSKSVAVGFQPDFTWIKTRGAGAHSLFDVVRGGSASNWLGSNTTSAETDYSSIFSFGFEANGIDVGYISDGSLNGSSQTYVGWNWKAGGTASSNTDGSITSSVSANTISGFSIGTYTGNSTSGATVGHGLSDTPDWIIVKTTSAADNWQVYHQALGNTSRLELNNTDAKGTSTALWNNTSPTSSVFSLGNGSVVNSSTRDYVFYAFAEKKGFSKFGSYTGNGSTDGTFVYTGFKPAWIMIKRTDTTGGWMMYDGTRDSFNLTEKYLQANQANAESTGADNRIDILSNGVKLKATGSFENASGGSYIYMAFAENPLVGTNNIPSTAR